MDSKDIKILNFLIKNSRVNASFISEEIGLSIPAVTERIKKLESSGVIKNYTVVLDHELLGKVVHAMIMVTLEHPKYNDGFVKAALESDSIFECHYIAGDFDYLLKVLATNTSKLERVLNYIKEIPGVSKTKTMIVLSTLKNAYSTNLKERTIGGKK